jgi:hypothetical protein
MLQILPHLALKKTIASGQTENDVGSLSGMKSHPLVFSILHWTFLSRADHSSLLLVLQCPSDIFSRVLVNIEMAGLAIIEVFA